MVSWKSCHPFTQDVHYCTALVWLASNVGLKCLHQILTSNAKQPGILGSFWWNYGLDCTRINVPATNCTELGKGTLEDECLHLCLQLAIPRTGATDIHKPSIFLRKGSPAIQYKIQDFSYILLTSPPPDFKTAYNGDLLSKNIFLKRRKYFSWQVFLCKENI